MPARFAPFKTERKHEFWIDGFKEPISGVIINVEFYNSEDNGVQTFLIIQADTMKYRVNLKSISVTAEYLRAA